MPVSSLSELSGRRFPWQPHDRHPSASSHQSALRSSGTLRSEFPDHRRVTKSPVARSAVRLKARAAAKGPIVVTHDIDFASRKSIAAGKTMGGECS
jgi:hypothetical protein